MYKNLNKIQDADIAGKTVVVRSNFDVPIANGEILDPTRIEAGLETIKYLLEQKAKVVIISHIGRPGGKEKDSMSLIPVRFELGKLLNVPIKFAHIHACENSIRFMEQGEVLLLENIRFYKEEESGSEEDFLNLYKPILNYCEVYINDNFGLYREHASVYHLAKKLPSYAGFAIQKEIEMLDKIKSKVERPFVAVLGGVKADTKIPLMKPLLDQIDSILIGGALAYTFLAASGVEIGKSVVEENKIEEAKMLLELAKKKKIKVYLPVDHIAAASFDKQEKAVVIETVDIPDNMMGMDIGPKTLDIFREVLETAQTIVWNGPMGVFEWEQFANGTQSVGQYIALSSPKSAFKVAGGAETTLAIKSLRINQKRFSHISAGGGMMTAYIGATKESDFSVLEILCK